MLFLPQKWGKGTGKIVMISVHPPRANPCSIFIRSASWAVLVLAGSVSGQQSFAQAADEPYFRLENRIFRAPISYSGGLLAGPEVHAQLYVGDPAEPAEAFEPLYPVANVFLRPDLAGYLELQYVILPTGYFSGQTVKVQIRAFTGQNWENSIIRGESVILERKLLDSTQGPNLLSGLEPFSLYTVPEPGTWCLLAVGGVALAVLGRFSRR